PAMWMDGGKGHDPDGFATYQKGDTHIGLETKRTDNVQQLRALLDGLEYATRNGGDQFRLSCLQDSLHAIRCICPILIMFIQFSYQGDLFRINVVDRDFFDLV